VRGESPAASAAPAAASAPAARGAFAGLVDLEGAPVELEPVERLDGLLCVTVVHFDEPEPSGSAGFAIDDDLG